MTLRIYTRTGDDGTTGLFGGARVSKDDVRVQAYGDVDELNAALGVARSAGTILDAEVARVQDLLFELGAALATPDPAKRRAGITEDDSAWLEQQIDRMESSLPPLEAFVLPAGTPQASALHLARAVCRRAERHCVRLATLDPSTPQTALVFLNRLSDWLFVAARFANHAVGRGDVEWHPR